jgi:hypothetical protein
MLTISGDSASDQHAVIFTRPLSMDCRAKYGNDEFVIARSLATKQSRISSVLDCFASLRSQ